MWLKTIMFVVVLVGCVVVVALYGEFRWQSGTEQLRARLDAGRQPITPAVYDAREVDDTSAEATLRDGDVTVTLLFRFNDAGLIGSVRAEARGRGVKGAVVPTPWEGHLWRYEVRDGMHIPLEAEVAWQLPQGPLPYWRGRITQIAYGFAR
jgi:hypothetical protein